MHFRDKLLVSTLLFGLGGCILAYDYDAHDGESAGGSGGSGGSGESSSSSVGGAGGEPASSSSSSSSSGMGGAGGGGDCASVLCDNRDKTCPQDCFTLNWAKRAGNGQQQFARGVAVDTNGNVAVVGEYHDTAFNFGTGFATQLSESTSMPGAAYTEGFMAYYDTAGNPLWALSVSSPNAGFMTNRVATSVAFNNTNQMVVVGRDYSSIAPPMRAFIRQLDPLNPLSSTNGWLLNTFAGETGSTEALAVATDQSNIYVVGRTNAQATVTCGANMVMLDQGVVIAKYDAGGKCIWINSLNATFDAATPVAITARNAPADGVWITGTYTNNLGLNPLPVLPAQGTATFVVNLNDADGSVRSGVRLSPQFGMTDGVLRPTALESLGTGSGGSGTLLLVGRMAGKTELNQELTSNSQSAAFITRLVVTPGANPLVNPATATHMTKVIAGPMMLDGARGTGIYLKGSKAYVAGTFATSATLPQGSLVMHTGNVPFLATIEATTLAVLGFDSFATGMDEESFATNQVFLGGNNTRIALAGGWIKKLDLSTPFGMTMGEILPVATTNESIDVFVSRFDLN